LWPRLFSSFLACDRVIRVALEFALALNLPYLAFALHLLFPFYVFLMDMFARDGELLSQHLPGQMNAILKWGYPLAAS
jgi:hypothetical protein